MMNVSPIRLFVYGSLRSGFRNPGYDYITGNFDYLGEALVRGQLRDAGYSPVAVAAEGDQFITGELYQLKDPSLFEWVFGQLDDYEGLNTLPDEIPLYKRELVEVYQAGKPLESWIYWYNRDVSKMTIMEPGEVMKYLQEKNKPAQ
jgi:gamma-glutamylcyclotransferase (GGCT)/AIG2-like uncharacterized protein YtfP